MPEWIYRFLVGWTEITVGLECHSAAVSLLWELGIPFWREKRRGEAVTFRLFRRDCETFLMQAEAVCIPCEVTVRGGLPVFLAICRRRPGLAVGGLACILWCLWSQGLVWEVDVRGLETLTVTQVEEILSDYGCGIGDRYGKIDFDQLHASVRADHPEIAWLSVYMHGTTAEVQLREKKVGTYLHHAPGVAANVTATEAGEILSVRVFEGQAAVGPGQVVLPGELLISGVVPMKTEEEVRTEYAAGEVRARVMRPILIEIPPEKEKTVYTGRVRTEKSVKIFKKIIKLFRNTGIPYATCDTIDKMEEVCLFGLYKIPVTIYSTDHRETTTVTETLSPEEAIAEGERRLRTEMDLALGTGEMLSRIVTAGFDENGVYRIHCLLYLEKDIGTTVEFTIHPTEEPPPSDT